MAKKLERDFQKDLVKELKKIFPGCIVLKNDTSYRQGIPDLLILFEDRWAALEVKKSPSEPFRPNQLYYLSYLNKLSYASVIFPENKEVVLNELQHALQS